MPDDDWLQVLWAPDGAAVLTFTDENGFYAFENLAPGEYQVFEHQPAGYFDGMDQAGSVGGVPFLNVNSEMLFALQRWGFYTFVVAALTHPGDNYHDMSRSTQLTNRAPQLSRLIDYMTGDWPSRPGGVAVDPNRIGAFGFSAGGFTVTSAIGGVSDAAAIGDHCQAHPGFFACRLLDAMGIDLSTWRPRAKDDRIKAAYLGGEV